MNKIVSKQIIDILIKAEDQASSTADKIKDKFKKFGDNAAKANEKAAKSSHKFNQNLIQTSNSLGVVGSGAAQAANILGQMKLDPKFGSTLDRAKLKVSEMGYDINSLEGRLRVFGIAGQTVWNNFKTRITSAATTLKGKMSAAIDSVRAKLQSLSTGVKGLGGSFGFLKSALSMTVGMIGFDLFNGLIQSARASINAASQLDYFGKRLNMTAKETTAFRKEIDGLQKEFRKVDMTAVGATAEEMAVKFNLPKQSIGDLTRMTAVLSSTFVKEGRSQEDAILAVSDALDGQFKRLQEIGITQQTLKDNGWNGNLEDQDSLIKALNKSMSEMGYEQTAKDITNLDEAWGALTIAGGQLLQKVLVPITPVLIRIIDYLLKAADAVTPLINQFANFVKSMPDWAKLGIAVAAFGAILVSVVIPAVTSLTLSLLGMAAAALLNPWTYVILAVVALAIAVYKLGQSFGWWDNVKGMLKAFWAGLQNIGNAVKSAWSNLSSFGGFLIMLTGPIGIVVAALRTVICALIGCSPGIVPALLKVQAMFGIVWAAIAGFVPGMVRGIVTTILNIIKQLPVKVLGFLKKVGSNFISQGSNWVKNAKNKASAVVTGTINHIKNLPSKVGSHITNTAHKINSGAQSWVNNAKQKASAMVSGVTGKISDLPGKVYNEFANIGKRMLSAGSSLVQKAKNIGKNIVKGLLDAMNIHSPGEIQEKVVAEFENTLGRVGDMTNSAYRTGSGFGSAIVDGFGDVNLGTDSDFNVYTGQKQTLEIHVTHDNNYSFEGLPDTISPREVASMINNAAEDDEWTKKLVTNPRFQKFDLKEKARITNRRNRSRGV